MKGTLSARGMVSGGRVGIILGHACGKKSGKNGRLSLKCQFCDW